jgi:hypothetical protein
MIAGFCCLTAFFITLKGSCRHNFRELIKQMWWLGVIGLVLMIVSFLLM